MKNRSRKISLLILIFAIMIFCITMPSIGFTKNEMVRCRVKSYLYKQNPVYDHSVTNPGVSLYIKQGDEKHLRKNTEVKYIKNVNKKEKICQVQYDGKKYLIKESNLETIKKEDPILLTNKAVYNKYKNYTEAQFKMMSKDELIAARAEVQKAHDTASSTVIYPTKLEFRVILARIDKAGESKGMEMKDGILVEKHSPLYAGPTGEEHWNQENEKIKKEIKTREEETQTAGGIGRDGDKSYTNPLIEGSSQSSANTHNIDEILNEADAFIDKGAEGAVKTIDEGSLKNMSNTIFTIFSAIGTVVAVAVGAFLGVKFMTESVSGKAEIKQMLVPYVIGCVVLFSAFGIWKLLIEIFSSLN